MTREEKILLVIAGVIFIVVILWSLVPCIIFAADTVKVYDKDWKRIYNVEKQWDGRWNVYDKDWVRQGYIESDGDTTRLYDTDWGRQQQTDTPNDFGILVDAD